MEDSQDPKEDTDTIWPETHWSWVTDVKKTDEARARTALDRLATTYREPVLKAILREGIPRSEAEDLCQRFFSEIIFSKDSPSESLFARADQEKGRLRSFIFISIKHFLGGDFKKKAAKKRGGGIYHKSWEEAIGEGRDPSHEAERPAPPISQFDRDWAAQVFAGALRALADDYYGSDRGELFEHLKPYVLAQEAKDDQQVLADRLGLKPGALRTALSRLRERFRKQLRAGVAQTVRSPDQIQEEMRYLCEVLMSQPSDDENPAPK